MNNMAANQKIERYLLRQMGEQEASEFEAFYLSDNECIDQLEMAERLLEGLRFAKDSQSLNATISVPGKAANDDRWWQKGLPIWASAAMLMVTLLPSVFMYQELQQQSSPNAELSVVNLPLTETRSTNRQALTVPYSEQRLILSMFVDTELEQMTYPHYAFEMTGLSDDKTKAPAAWIISHLELDSNDMLYIDLGKSAIKPDSYRFVLIGITKDNEKQEVNSGTLTFEAK